MYNYIPTYPTGSPYLSGSSACDWYFNPDIQEAQIYYSRYTLHLQGYKTILLPMQSH
jgi:hypothetical protein